MEAKNWITWKPFIVHEDGDGPPATLDEIKRRYIKHVIAICDGDRNKAAGFLDISRETINRLEREGKLK